MTVYFADLHIHVGRSGDGQPVKISAAPGMTVETVLDASRRRKGIDIVAIVDAGSPGVIADISRLVEEGTLTPLLGGGLRHINGVVLFPAMEVEIGLDGAGPAHYVGYFPSLAAVGAAARRIGRHVTNRQLSTQRARIDARRLLAIVEEEKGVFVPAHVFTPHRGFYGACGNRLTDVFGDEARRIHAIELGLSADAAMADRLDELGERAFLSSSDAHSLPKIAREYTVFEMREANFDEWRLALKGKKGRGIKANYGLHPALGKYYRSGCPRCGWIARGSEAATTCASCGHKRLVTGVLDRLLLIQDDPKPTPRPRPPYIHQTPLQFIPGIGPRRLERLLDRFGTEMNALHHATAEELTSVVGAKITEHILHSRVGKLSVQPGGGGVYGKVTDET